MKAITILELVGLAGFSAQVAGIALLCGWQVSLIVGGTELLIISIGGAYFATR